MKLARIVLALGTLLVACDASEVAPPAGAPSPSGTSSMPDRTTSASPVPLAEPVTCRQAALRADEVLVYMLPENESPYERDAYVGRVRRLSSAQVRYPIRATLGYLLAGSSAREETSGCSALGDLGGIIRSLALDAGVLTIDLTDDRKDFSWISASFAGATFLGLMASTLAQFDEVHEVRFELEGSCIDFAKMMESVECTPLVPSEWGKP